MRFARFSVASALLAIGALSPAQGQRSSGPEMFLDLLAGNRYVRTVFAPGGELRSRSEITVGTPELEDDGSVELDLEIVRTGKDGQQATEHSTWRCASGEQSMLMSVLFLSEDRPAATRLSVSGDRVLYPRPPLPARLPDLDLELTVERGVFAAFGGKSRIRISERELTSVRPDGGYAIGSTVSVKGYALGIRVKQASFSSLETVDPQGRLVSQRLERANGARILLERVGG